MKKTKLYSNITIKFLKFINEHLFKTKKDLDLASVEPEMDTRKQNISKHENMIFFYRNTNI